MRLALLALTSVLLMYLDHREHHLEAIRSALTVALSPIQYVMNLPAQVGNWAQEGLRTHASLLADIDALRQQTLIQQIQLQRLAAMEQENIRLRSLLGSSAKVGERMLIGEIIAVDMDPFKHQVLINRGSTDQVFDQQPVLDAHGVMGQVVHVTPVNSTVLLLTDPSHAIPVQVNRNGMRALALGTGVANQLVIPHIPNNADIKPGDLLVTSGLGQRFPPGYPVAVVTQVERDPGRPYARILARPSANLEQIREVLLVWRSEPVHAPPKAEGEGVEAEKTDGGDEPPGNTSAPAAPTAGAGGGQ